VALTKQVCSGTPSTMAFEGYARIVIITGLNPK